MGTTGVAGGLPRDHLLLDGIQTTTKDTEEMGLLQEILATSLHLQAGALLLHFTTCMVHHWTGGMMIDILVCHLHIGSPLHVGLQHLPLDTGTCHLHHHPLMIEALHPGTEDLIGVQDHHRHQAMRHQAMGHHHHRLLHTCEMAEETTENGEAAAVKGAASGAVVQNDIAIHKASHSAGIFRKVVVIEEKIAAFLMGSNV